MKIDGMVHCMFEQSGTFKKEFKKLGIYAEDYDIQNNFGETDHIVDLFEEIDVAYERERETVFDRIGKDDLIMAFYPCIYFCAASQMHFYITSKNHKNLTFDQKITAIIERNKKRNEFYERLIKLVEVCTSRGLRLIIENPWSEQTYLKGGGFLKVPDVVDNNRLLRGDYFKKPTAYWYWNCVPTYGESWQTKRERDRQKKEAAT